MEVSEVRNCDNSVEQTPAGDLRRARSLAELLLSGDFPLVRHVLNLKEGDIFEPNEGYELPAPVLVFFRTIFSTYQSAKVTTATRETERLASPRVLLDTPNLEQIATLIGILTMYQPPYGPSHFTFDEFLFRHHIMTQTYRKPGNLVNILKVLGARVRAPTKHDIVFAYVAGRYESPLWDELKQDIHALVKDALDELLVD